MDGPVHHIGAMEQIATMLTIDLASEPLTDYLKSSGVCPGCFRQLIKKGLKTRIDIESLDSERVALWGALLGFSIGQCTHKFYSRN